MREWHLTPADPMAARIAADARTGRTNYLDDQTWQLYLGKPDEPALALETHYGGRVGLARVVPIWLVGRRQVYETQGYHSPPVLTAFAPDYLRLRADLTLHLRVVLEFWTMESQAVGGRFIVTNTSDHPQTLRLDLAAQAARNDQSLQMFFLTLENNEVALQLGRLPNLQPVLMMPGATESGSKARIGRTESLDPGAQVVFRWVLAGLPTRDTSIGLAYRWLAHADWDQYIGAIEARANATPQIETGHADWDLAIAWSQQLVLRSFLGATGSLPHPSFVSSRKPHQGFALTGNHAEGFHSAWGGQSAPDALAIAPAVAQAAPELAEGLVYNFLAVQRDDGWIDAKPGLGGQRSGVLAPPMLATLAYTVYHYTRRKAFLEHSLDGLHAFFERWFRADTDRDQDGVPEWDVPDQGAFRDSPTLAQHRRWAQGIDCRVIEAPDLLAYLLREARSLTRIAEVVGRADVSDELAPTIAALHAALETMWDAEKGAFHYRDRDTHACPTGEALFSGKGDQAFDQRTTLPTPSRLIVRVSGGLSRKPRLECTIEGLDAHGKPANETIPYDAFDWYRSMGAATTRTVWREVRYLTFSGLSRVYTVTIDTIDLSQHDQSLFMPLWAGDLAEEQVQRMVAQLTDPDQYWRAYGVAGCPASGPAFDAALQNGCGGSWPRWNAMLAWALLDHDYRAQAADLFTRVLAAQVRSLTGEGTFRAAYNPDTGEGMGDSGVIEGTVSMGWFARLFGAFVPAPEQVIISGPFSFGGERMSWTQHGIRITRSEAETTIRFASGQEVTLPPDAPPQAVRDPKAGQSAPRPMAEPADPAAAFRAPAPPTSPPPDDLLPDGS